MNFAKLNRAFLIFAIFLTALAFRGQLALAEDHGGNGDGNGNGGGHGGGVAPEPGSIALLVIGGGLVGNKIRKNRKAKKGQNTL
jgi:hypothetical protein